MAGIDMGLRLGDFQMSQVIKKSPESIFSDSVGAIFGVRSAH